MHQKTFDEQKKGRGKRLLDRRKARFKTIYHRMMIWAIDDRIGMAGDAWVMTFSELAYDCQMSRMHAYRIANELHKDGIIDFSETEPQSGKYSFRIVWSNISELAEMTVQEPKKKRGRPEKVVTGGDRINEKVVTGGENLSLVEKTCNSQRTAPLISATKRNNSAHKTGAPAAVGEIPPELRTEEFQTAWSDWCVYRKSKRKPVTELAAKQQLKKLAAVGAAAAVESIEESIANDWQGIFPKPQGAQNGKSRNGRSFGPENGPGQRYDPTSEPGTF